MLRGRPFPGSRRGRQNRGPQRSGRCRRRKTAQNQGHNRKSKGQKQHIHDFSPYHRRQTCREKRAACGSSRGTPTASQQPHAAWSSRRVTDGSFLARSGPRLHLSQTTSSRAASWFHGRPQTHSRAQPASRTRTPPGNPAGSLRRYRPCKARIPPAGLPGADPTRPAGGREGGTPLVLSPIRPPHRRETGRIPCQPAANRPHRRTADEQTYASSSRHDALRHTAEAPAQICIVTASASGVDLGVVAGHVFAPVVASGGAPANRRVQSVPARVCALVRDGSLRHCTSPPHTAGPDGPTVRAGCHWGRQCGRPARLVPRTLRAPAHYLTTGAHAGGVPGTAFRPALAAKRATSPHCDSAATAPPACAAETS